MQKSVIDPSIPYIGLIHPESFQSQRLIRIQGLVPPLAYRFNVNLQCGPNAHPQDDIALQVSVHLLDNYIALNTLQNGIWGFVQRDVRLPIQRAQRFEIVLLNDGVQYKLAINGQHYCDYPQIIHPGAVTHLAINGDVSIIKISYESAFPTPGTTSASPINDISDFEMIDSPKTSPLGLNANSMPPPPYESIIKPSGVTQPYPAASAPPSQTISQPMPNDYSGFPPPAGQPIPLNSPFSRAQPIKRNKIAKKIVQALIIFAGIVFIILAVTGKIALGKHRS